jgi:hypothetical protein
MSDTFASLRRKPVKGVEKPASFIGAFCRRLPPYVRDPPTLRVRQFIRRKAPVGFSSLRGILGV